MVYAQPGHLGHMGTGGARHEADLIPATQDRIAVTADIRDNLRTLLVTEQPNIEATLVLRQLTTQLVDILGELSGMDEIVDQFGSEPDGEGEVVNRDEAAVAKPGSELDKIAAAPTAGRVAFTRILRPRRSASLTSPQSTSPGHRPQRCAIFLLGWVV